MGAPLFKVKDIIQKYQVKVFSSNYALYGDLSGRVMSLLSSQFPQIEIYSIDEAFLDLRSIEQESRVGLLEQSVKDIFQSTSIPVSIGMAPTKVLAKVANRFVKQSSIKSQVYNLDPQSQKTLSLLQTLPVSQLWGIGSRYSRKLNSLGIFSALDLRNSDHRYIRQRFNVNIARIVLELRGLSCLNLEEVTDKKSYRSSRSFGEKVSTKQQLWESLSGHISGVCEKLRANKTQASFLQVFIQSSKYSSTPIYSSLSHTLSEPSDNTFIFLDLGKKMLDKMYQQGHLYSKSGAYFCDLHYKKDQQTSLLTQKTSQKHSDLLNTLDRINRKYGKKTIKVASMGHNPSWQMKSSNKSPNYTTKWSDIVIVK